MEAILNDSINLNNSQSSDLTNYTPSPLTDYTNSNSSSSSPQTPFTPNTPYTPSAPYTPQTPATPHTDGHLNEPIHSNNYNNDNLSNGNTSNLHDPTYLLSNTTNPLPDGHNSDDYISNAHAPIPETPLTVIACAGCPAPAEGESVSVEPVDPTTHTDILEGGLKMISCPSGCTIGAELLGQPLVDPIALLDDSHVQYTGDVFANNDLIPLVPGSTNSATATNTENHTPAHTLELDPTLILDNHESSQLSELVLLNLGLEEHTDLGYVSP